MNLEQIDKYLFHEMPENEREQFENKFVGKDELFYEIAERENEIVDGYVKGTLAGDERNRFEQSLDRFPARRQKVENAKTLREFITEERPATKTITLAERSGFLSRFFSFGPALQFASVALIVILALTSVFLWSENRRLGSLQQELAASRQRESDLAARVEEENATSGDLAADLESEREKIADLQAEIAKLGDANKVRPAVNNPAPVIATLFLSTVGVRGDAVPVKRLELSPGVLRVSIVAGIPDIGDTADAVAITLNGERIAENAKVVVRRGEKSVSFTVPAAKLKAGRNDLTLNDSKNSVMARYIIAVSQAQ